MEKRQDRRWPRQLDVRCWRPGDEPSAIRGVASNVSTTGMFLRTNSVAPPGTRLRVELGHSKRSFVAEAVVVRAIRTPSHMQSVKPSGMGLRFLTAKELLTELLPGLMALQQAPRQVEERRRGADRRRSRGRRAGDRRAAAGSPRRSSPAATEKPAPPETPEAPRPREGAPAARRPLFRVRYRSPEQFRSAFERDMVTGGMFVPVRTPPGLHEIVDVEVSVEGAASGVERVQARVVHQRPRPAEGAPGGANILVGVGLELLDPDQAVERLRLLLEGGDDS